jgi:hypothetical protein
MFKYTPFIKLNFGFVCVRLGAKRVVCKRFTVSKYQPLFIQSQHQFQPFLILLHSLMTKIMTVMT